MTVQDVIKESVENNLGVTETIQALKQNGFKKNARKQPWRPAYVRFLQTKVKVKPIEKTTPVKTLDLADSVKQLDLMRQVLDTDWSDDEKLGAITQIYDRGLTEPTFTKTMQADDTLLIEVHSILDADMFAVTLKRWQAREILASIDAIKAFVESDLDQN